MALAAANVKILIETELADGNIDAFIADAAALMSSSGISAAPCHDAASLEVLQKYLTAHLVALYERQLKSDKEGEAAETYGGDFAMGLDFTQYGQQAVMFDCSGILAGLDGVPLQFGSFGGAGGASADDS